MALQLQAIDEHNSKLPPRKKAKESLPEISAPNVHCKELMHRDAKKGTLGVIRKYRNIGLADASSVTPQGLKLMQSRTLVGLSALEQSKLVDVNDHDAPAGSAKAFSMANQAR